MGSTEKTEISGSNIVTTPTVTASNIKSKYPDAVIKRADGTDISGTSDLIGTGATITTGGKSYTVVKLGDTSGDGKITPSDYVKIKNKIMGSNNLDESQTKAADVNRDGSVSPADYVKVKNNIMGVSNINL